MTSTDLNELLAFLAVARLRSFRGAAAERRATPSAISHAIRRLETRLDLRLLNRSTRSVSLTEPGQRLFDQMAPLFENMSRAFEDLNAFRDTPFGTVRLSVANSIAPHLISPIIAPVLRANPSLHLEVIAADRLVDIVAEGFDAGIRFGQHLSQDMIATKIGPAPRIAVVGAPDYFARRGTPQHPQELVHHACIRYAYPDGRLFHWRFYQGTKSLSIAVNGPATFDYQGLMIDAALDGVGLAYVWETRVTDLLAQGRLMRCLDAWTPPRDDLFIYYPSRRHVPAGLRVVIDALKGGGPAISLAASRR
ncbi:MAG: LysR family transcriptional regulator [Paracoccus sp. (in: a-proteobacteria)]|nr:LysR family transcriptional regulator [Paracoccus sp. (in: a-proteobacteria)]MDO5632385.1 LysR family transcriptional regulator [Paracoccus sp. (in: a-proteobacteria)]